MPLRGLMQFEIRYSLRIRNRLALDLVLLRIRDLSDCFPRVRHIGAALRRATEENERGGSLSSPKVNIVMRKALRCEPFGPLGSREKISAAPAHRAAALRYFERASGTARGGTGALERARTIPARPAQSSPVVWPK
ncbi:unnamed protein product, partial [Iphiclides podalirius]